MVEVIGLAYKDNKLLKIIRKMKIQILIKMLKNNSKILKKINLLSIRIKFKDKKSYISTMHKKV